MKLHYFRDDCNRLTHDRADIDSTSYPEVCKKIADRFDLKPASQLLIGPEQMFWDFTNGKVTVELGWDIWMCFMITAQQAEAETLVRQMAIFLAEMIPPALVSHS